MDDLLRVLANDDLKQENKKYKKALKKKREEICQLRAVIVKLDHYVNVNRYTKETHKQTQNLLFETEKMRQNVEAERAILRAGLGDVWNMALRAAETYNNKGRTVQDMEENFHGLLASLGYLINKLHEIMNS